MFSSKVELSNVKKLFIAFCSTHMLISLMFLVHIIMFTMKRLLLQAIKRKLVLSSAIIVQILSYGDLLLPKIATNSTPENLAESNNNPARSDQ